MHTAIGAAAAVKWLRLCLYMVSEFMTRVEVVHIYRQFLVVLFRPGFYVGR